MQLHNRFVVDRVSPARDMSYTPIPPDTVTVCATRHEAVDVSTQVAAVMTCTMVCARATAACFAATAAARDRDCSPLHRDAYHHQFTLVECFTIKQRQTSVQHLSRGCMTS
jgi:hypothetical protein